MPQPNLFSSLLPTIGDNSDIAGEQLAQFGFSSWTVSRGEFRTLPIEEPVDV
jgi:hypothetical protein